MVTRPGAGRLVTVFGGSGFVGRHTISVLARRGWRVRAAVRRPDLAGHLQPMGNVGQIQAVQANVRYPESVAAAIEGADAVINLVAVMSSSGRQTLQAVNVDGARAIAAACARADTPVLVHMSALGAAPKSPGNYGQSKAAGERAVFDGYADAIIMRPSIMFGPEDEFFNRFASMAAVSPLMPLIGGGRTRFQPIHVGDVAEAIANAVEGQAHPGSIYELGGPDVMTFRKLLDKTQKWAGRERRYFPLPFWLAKLVGLLTWPLPNAIRPITVDQVRMLQRDNVVSNEAIEENRTVTALGIAHPTAADIIVPTYLVRFRPKGQYSHYRS